MVNIQLDLDLKRNRIVELYKTKYGLKTKPEVIFKLIDSIEKDFKEEEINRDWRTEPATEKQIEVIKKILKSKDIPKNITKGEADRIIKESKREEDIDY